MKIFGTAAALAAALCIYSTNSNAEDFEHKVNLHALVPVHCESGEPTASGQGFAPNPTAAQSVFNINVTGGVADETEGVLIFENFVCNAKLHVYISSGRVLTNSAVAAGEEGDLAREIPYKVAFLYRDMGYNFNEEIPQDIYISPTSDAFQVMLKIRVDGQGSILAAGNYSDTLTLNFSPQI